MAFLLIETSGCSALWVKNYFRASRCQRCSDGRSERLEGAIERIPLKRLGPPAGLAGAALFLASPLASCIVGQTLVVDGGLIL
jgi:3-oxoacyl-[acyl-carrier protein] reductase